MKIDSNEKIQQVAGSAPDVAKKTQVVAGFDTVLKDTILQSNSAPAGEENPVRQMMRTSPGLEILPNYQVTADAVADGLIEVLETYQQMLADPAADLRMIQPVIEQMRTRVAGTETVLAGIPDDNPVKAIVRETVMCMTEEVDKFYSGYYVDD